MVSPILFLCVLFIGALAQSPNTLGFVTLGGNVKWHKSDVSIKAFASSLQVYLYRMPLGGSQSEPTLLQRAPVQPNGAYSVVVSNNGAYRLKLAAPKGWNFIPRDGFGLNIDDSYSIGNNYAFELTGFDVFGQVVTTGMTTGPPNLILSLLTGTAAPSDASVIVGRSKTTTDGSFVLSSVSPGDYTVVVSDTESITGPEDVRASSRITVSTNSLRIEKPLILQGHLLRSKMTFAGSGVAQIPVVLFIPKSSTLTPADLEIFGCSKISKSQAFPLPVELQNIASPDPICQTLSDNEGSFSFSRLAGGDYYLVAYHDKVLTPHFKSSLTISPNFLFAKMKHTDLHMTQGFQITNFHLSGGRVQLTSDVPVAGAEILIDGVSTTKTDSKGLYELDLTAPRIYKIDVKFSGLQFATVTANLSPSSDKLPTFSPSAIEQCGQIKFAAAQRLRLQDLPMIEFVTGGKVSSSVAASLSDDKTLAHFCTYLSPEKHTVRLTKFPTGVHFTPSSVHVDLHAGPAKEILFTQFQAKVMGEVVCSQKCPLAPEAPRLAVRVVHIDHQIGDDFPPQFIILEADPANAKRATFSISSVSPGSYILELVATTTGTLAVPASGWCWSETGWRHSVEVVDKDLHYSTTPSLRFEQSGYRIRVEAPLLQAGFNHPIDVTFTGKFKIPTNETKPTPTIKLHYSLSRPISEMCLPNEPEVFDVVAETSCLRLSSPRPNQIRPISDISVSSASAPFTIQLNVHELPVEVVVQVSREFDGLTSSNLPQLTIDVTVTQAGTQVAGRARQLSANWSDQMMRTNLWAAPGDAVKLEVKPSTKTPQSANQVEPLLIPSSTQILRVPASFPKIAEDSKIDEPKSVSSPPKKNYKDTSACSGTQNTVFGSDLLVKFIMKPGFYFTGAIISQEPVSKALVNVFADPSLVSSTLDDAIDLSGFTSPEESPVAGLSLVTRTLTNERGEFRIGPVYAEPGAAKHPASLLTLSIQKPGYEFSQEEKARPGSEYTFTARKLALVELKVVTENNEPLPNTLITIIGNVFRGSEATDANGIVRYIGLPKGEYYIQLILKEYDFVVRQGKKFSAPMEHALSVVDGGSLSFELVGKRVAFSAFGRVTSLSDVPEPDVLVEAELVSETGGQKTYPETVPDVVGACRHIQDIHFPVPVEQATTDANGRFKLLGLLPGCLYKVSVRSRLDEAIVEGDSALPLRTVPGQIIVRASLQDVDGLHFYVSPQAHVGQIFVTVDATDEELPNLSVIIHPLNQPNVIFLKHKFATEALFFSISGKHMHSMLGNAYTIRLERNFQMGPRDRNSTLQQYNFNVAPTGSNHHFKFTGPSSHTLHR